MRKPLWSCLIIATLALAGCSEKNEDAPTDHLIKGVSLSPRSFGSEDFAQFLELTQEAGDLVMWAGDWLALTDTASAAYVTVGLAATYHYTPLIAASISNGDGTLLRPLSDSIRAVYASGAAIFAARFHPAFLGLGVEINSLYEHSPSDFDEFVAFFREARDSVKTHSPSTQVFTVFQLEKMKGLKGGLFGGVNDTTQSEWHLLERFPSADFFAFTTYPCLVFGHPADIPSNYYTDIGARTGRPIAFTEIGWHTAASPSGWESSEDEQSRFVTRLFELIRPAEPEFIIWSFLFDQDVQEPFTSMGLWRRSDGQAKSAWSVWVGG